MDDDQQVLALFGGEEGRDFAIETFLDGAAGHECAVPEPGEVLGGLVEQGADGFDLSGGEVEFGLIGFEPGFLEVCGGGQLGGPF